MRATLLVITIMSGCATIAPYQPMSYPREGRCLVVAYSETGRGRGLRIDDTLYLDGQRVPGNDIVAATAADARANAIADGAVRHQRLGIGGILLGAALLAPGAGLVGFGDDHNQHAALGVGAALTAVGGAAILGGVFLYTHGLDERQRALVAYNDDMPPGCH